MGLPEELKARMQYEKITPRWLVVDADPRGYMDKDVGCSFYPFGNCGDAEWFAKRLTEYREGIAQSWGGYPGAVYVLDLCDPNSYADPEDCYEALRALEEENE